MNILHIYKAYFPVLGCIENHVRALAEAQVQKGHTVTVLVTHASRSTVEEIFNGVRLVKAGRLATVASTPLSLTLPGLVRRLEREADLAHLHAPYPVGELAQLVAGCAPYVVTYHADVMRASQRFIMNFYGPLFRRCLRGATRILPTSAGYAASSPWLRGLEAQLTVVPLGVDIQRFDLGQPAAAAADTVTVLFVGQLRHYKGVDTLLQAMAQLPANVHLQVAGEGPMRVQWETLSRQLDLGDRVTFLGRVSDECLPALYQGADIFVLPANNRAEAFGTVLVEAMAAGLPCITTEINSGNSYVVQDNVTGLIVPPSSPSALADAIARLAKAPGWRRQLGQAGHDRARREFTVNTMVDRVEKVYEAVIPRARP